MAHLLKSIIKIFRFVNYLIGGASLLIALEYLALNFKNLESGDGILITVSCLVGLKYILWGRGFREIQGIVELANDSNQKYSWKRLANILFISAAFDFAVLVFEVFRKTENVDLSKMSNALKDFFPALSDIVLIYDQNERFFSGLADFLVPVPWGGTAIILGLIAFHISKKNGT